MTGAKAMASSVAGSRASVVVRMNSFLAGPEVVPGRMESDRGVGGGGVGDGEFAGADAALVEGGHGGAPVAGGLGAVFFGEGELDELFGFGEGGGGDFGADGGGGAEGGRRAGSGGGGGGLSETGGCGGAAPSRVSVLWVRNSRRDFDMGPLEPIVAGGEGEVVGEGLPGWRRIR